MTHRERFAGQADLELQAVKAELEHLRRRTGEEDPS
jgi:hypothetical protein